MQVDHISLTERTKLLGRLGAREEEPSVRHLAFLQRAWLFAQPFHNLDLLAAHARGAAPLSPEESIQRCAAGLGGPCHVQSIAFLRLLRALGFEAHLCGARINHPDDHLLIHVLVEGRRFFCDVGNGQPYLLPFPADRALRQEHLGWVVWSRPEGRELLVERASQDHPATRIVYRASAAPRTWSDFAGAIARHHREPGFGPFLTGLRIVRMGPERMIAVRDDVCTRTEAGRFERQTMTLPELARFVKHELALDALPVDEAIAAFRASTGRA
ncbi:MAG: arylamine N-acetyltransferase [Polyangiaceae bacterium]